MAVSDAEVVFGVVGYFAILTILLGTFGIGGPAVFVPDSGSVVEASGGDPDDPQLFLAASSALCVGGIGVAVFSLGVGLVAAAIGCSGIGLSLLAPDVGDDINAAFLYVFAFARLFFQVVTFQLPVHVVINFILVMPAGAAIGYLGIRVFRGGG